eukprot:CAMPEP_0201721354 /NCGR_PEP_ID=MMETSP0593-20130828/6041_1 /ASSEMBLY_ACC=CAM_ASM_000672 /TAXON_ID=267983 /ORGANISM="Skeletonema japonicum, Strain CCMP2506" /LENGTH=342 /DNA_ID=CAMNT_0048212153 /DNA_START=82 /DNA_END=1110 /DNA_ORIENTATION=+
MPSTSDLFSLITETNNTSHQRPPSIHNEAHGSISSSSSNADGSGDFQRGTLILEGEEQTNNTTSSDEEKFTVPESVFLPSEIGTLEGQSRNSNNEQDNSVQESRKSHNADNEQKYSNYFPPKQLLAHGVATFVVVVGMLMLSTWRSLAWRKEAQHLKEVLHLQMQHHSSLELKIESLEADLAAWNGHHKDPHNWKFEKGHWEIDDDDDNIVLSFKNCYLEASLALGQCSKKWQDWFLGQGGADTDERQGGAGSDEFATDEDGFTDDMTRLVDGIIDEVAAVSSNSFSFVEKTLKQMSQFYNFGDDFNASDADSWNESEISQVLSNARKVAESAVGEAATLLI